MTEEPDLESAYALRTPEDSRRLYKAWAERYDAEFVAAKGYRFPRRIAETYLAEGGGWPCLDIGCGTGAVAAHLPEGAVIDGVDISPEMLAVAGAKGRYRALIEADLTQPLPLDQCAYQGMVSSGTFTEGHVGAEALVGLTACLCPGGLAVLSVKTELFPGFALVLEWLQDAGQISAPWSTEEPIYADPAQAPEGHGADTGLILRFRKI